MIFIRYEGEKKKNNLKEEDERNRLENWWEMKKRL